MSPPLWVLEEVTMPGRAQPRLAQVSLTIHRGITAILGASGAGKTSLCNLLVGFEQAASGVVRPALPRSDGRLPLYWSPDGGLWPSLSVAAHLTTVAPQAPSRAVGDLLSLFALDHCAAATPAQLSTGERERLGVARAVASEAAVLVLDEPFSHVDDALAARCWQVLLDLVRARDGSLVYSTHAPERVIGHAHQVICLRDGGVLHHGAVDELYHHPPSLAAATCLGATNWFGHEDAEWVPGSDVLGSVRPECLLVRPDVAGDLVVSSAAFHGHVATVTVMRRGDQRQRTWVHRPHRPLMVGERVTLTLLHGPENAEARRLAATAITIAPQARGAAPLMTLMLLLTLGVFTGCDDDQQPALTFRHERSWNLPPVAASQPAPRALGALGSDQVLVLDTAGRVLVYDGAGTLVRQWQMPAFTVGRPEGVVELPDGRIAVADTHYHRVVLFDAAGVVTGMIGGPDEDRRNGGFLYPVGVTTDRNGNLYVSEYGGNDRVQKFAGDGRHLATFGTFGTAPGSFQRPQGLSWADGRLYIADAMNNRIQVFHDDGRFIGVLGGDQPPELHFPYHVVVGADGALTVVEYSGGCITRLSPTGALLGRYGRPGSGDAQFATPWGMAIDGQGRVWVADTGNRRLVELTP